MRTVSVTEARAHLGELVDEEELEELRETLFWLSQPGVREDLAEADTGETISSSELRDELGLDPIG